MKTIVYKYGLRSPITGVADVNIQLHRAHTYYNKLIEIEHARREKVRAIQGLHPEVEACKKEVDKATEERDAARAVISKARKGTRTRSEKAEQRAKVRELKEKLKELRAKLKEAKAHARLDLSIQAGFKQADEDAQAAGRTARAECGLYWGSYLWVERAVAAASKAVIDPDFKRWRGSGAVAVQVQHGLPSLPGPLATDTRVQITDQPSWIPNRKTTNRREYKLLRLRIGSDESRNPVWAEWPIILHRPIPIEALITWVAVRREKIADGYRWIALFTLDLPDSWQRERPDTAGVVAVDIGWRRRGSGLRVAYLRDGNGLDEQILMDESVERGLHKAEDLRSIRDKNLDELRPVLAKWLCGRALPEAWGDVSSLNQWKSPARFVALLRRWQGARVEDDGAMFLALEGWAKQDTHLWRWEANQRDKMLAKRRDQYRVIAAKLARKYKTLIIEKFDLSQTQRRKPPESEKVDRDAAHAQQRLAAVSVLRQCMVDAFSMRGGIVVRIPAVNTTKDCEICGFTNTWNQADELRHKCDKCGAEWDQDSNAGGTLFNRYREWCDDPTKQPDVEVTDYAGPRKKRKSRFANKGKHSKATVETPGPA